MRESGFRAIGNLAQRLTAGVAKERGGSIVRLRADWSAIAGPELARKTRPEALLANRGRAGKVLRLRVAGAAALEVQHMQGQLIERVNAYFGHRAIDDIRLVQGAIVSVPTPRPVPKPDAQTTARMEGRVADVKDPDLRAALARLGARVTLNRRGILLGRAGCRTVRGRRCTGAIRHGFAGRRVAREARGPCPGQGRCAPGHGRIRIAHLSALRPFSPRGPAGH